MERKLLMSGDSLSDRCCALPTVILTSLAQYGQKSLNCSVTSLAEDASCGLGAKVPSAEFVSARRSHERDGVQSFLYSGTNHAHKLLTDSTLCWLQGNVSSDKASKDASLQ